MKKSIQKILTEMKTVAVVGVSDKKDRASYRVAKYLVEQGYRVYGVRPDTNEIQGIKCYNTISELPSEVEVINVFRKSQFIPDITEQSIAFGAKAVWLQLDLQNEESEKRARLAGLEVVSDKYMLLEIKNLKAVGIL